MKQVLISDLKIFSEKALIRAGMSETDAETSAEVLVTTDSFGVLSHGTKNLLGYIQKMQAGGLDPKAEPTVECEGPAWAVLNGNAALGMVSSCKAMKMAIEKARKTGIAYVGVHNSCHFGAAGYYANLSAKEGMIGLSMSNGDPIMAVPNSSGVAIGNNPFSFAVPFGDGKSVFLDIALSNVAALKVVMAKEKGIQVPENWLVDKTGKPTTDPSGFPKESFLQPMAAHKGYGLAVLVEVLASVLTGAGMLSEVTSWNLSLSNKNNVGHAFLAIDISKMMPEDVFKSRIAHLAEELKNAPKAQNADDIYLPGEMDWNKREKALSDGFIEITDVMADNLQKIANMLGMEPCLVKSGL